ASAVPSDVLMSTSASLRSEAFASGGSIIVSPAPTASAPNWRRDTSALRSAKSSRSSNSHMLRYSGTLEHKCSNRHVALPGGATASLYKGSLQSPAKSQIDPAPPEQGMLAILQRSHTV